MSFVVQALMFILGATVVVYGSDDRGEDKCATFGPQGVTYINWGKKSCGKCADVVYTGQMGGNKYNHRGGGVNYLCLPDNPQNGPYQSFANSQIWGVEYQIHSANQPSGMKTDLLDHEIPCAVCHRTKRSSVLVIPGRKTCYPGWEREYFGYLMSDQVNLSNKDFICMNIKADPLDNLNSNDNHAVIKPLRTACGSLRCPPYQDKTNLYCVVCTK